jgi:hypothetical protein
MGYNCAIVQRVSRAKGSGIIGQAGGHGIRVVKSDLPGLQLHSKSQEHGHYTGGSTNKKWDDYKRGRKVNIKGKGWRAKSDSPRHFHPFPDYIIL